MGPLLAVLGRLGLEKVKVYDYLEKVLISRAGTRFSAGGAILSRSWGLCWLSWAALGAYVGGLGPLLEPMLAVLGRSWSLCWRSGGVLGPKWSVLGRSGRSWEGTGAEKWPKPERESRSGEAIVFHCFLCWRSLGLCWRSCAALGAYVGGLGLLLVFM